jgi:hypothetical protein
MARVNLITDMFLLFTCKHFWVWRILRNMDFPRVRRPPLKWPVIAKSLRNSDLEQVLRTSWCVSEHAVVFLKHATARRLTGNVHWRITPKSINERCTFIGYKQMSCLHKNSTPQIKIIVAVTTTTVTTTDTATTTTTTTTVAATTDGK